jgi:hypothetical protein
MNVPDTVVTDILRFIEASSVLGKRAMDRVVELEKSGSDATPKVAAVTDTLIAQKLISTEKKAEAIKVLSSHSGALDVLSGALKKLAAAKDVLLEKKASLGAGETPDGDVPNASLTSPFVGLRGSTKKASDIAYETRLGLHAAS